MKWKKGCAAILNAAAALLFLAAAMPSVAAASDVTEDRAGIYLGLKIIGSSLHVDEDEDIFIEDDGGGLQLDFGYRFNPVFALELSFGGATHETIIPDIDANFYMVELLAYYRFLPDKPFRPFIKGGFGGYGLEIEEGSVDAKIEGGGLALGGGFRYFFSRHFALGLDLTHNMIKYDKGQLSLGEFSIETDLDEDGSQTSLGLTLSYSF